jgi:hypothetical protein
MPVLINLFEVEPADDDAFVAGWTRARGFLDERTGGVPTALHRALSDAEFRFVNIAQIPAPGPSRAAIMSPEFPGRQMPGRPHPALYEVEREHGDAAAAEVVLINAFEVPPGEDDDFVAGWQRAADRI